MPSGIVFWAVVAVCASFYFDLTATGLRVAGQADAALATGGIQLLLVIPSLVMVLREALRLLRRP